MKKLLWFTTYIAVGYGGYWLYQKLKSEQQEKTLVSGRNQQGGSSIFNEPDLEPVNLAAAATTLVA